MTADPNCKRCGGTGRGTGMPCSCTWATKAPPSPESRLDAIERRQRMLAWALAVLAQRNSGGAMFTDEDPVFMAILDEFGEHELNMAGREAEHWAKLRGALRR